MIAACNRGRAVRRATGATSVRAVIKARARRTKSRWSRVGIAGRARGPAMARADGAAGVRAAARARARRGRCRTRRAAIVVRDRGRALGRAIGRRGARAGAKGCVRRGTSMWTRIVRTAAVGRARGRAMECVDGGRTGRARAGRSVTSRRCVFAWGTAGGWGRAVLRARAEITWLITLGTNCRRSSCVSFSLLRPYNTRCSRRMRISRRVSFSSSACCCDWRTLCCDSSTPCRATSDSNNAKIAADSPVAIPSASFARSSSLVVTPLQVARAIAVTSMDRRTHFRGASSGCSSHRDPRTTCASASRVD